MNNTGGSRGIQRFISICLCKINHTLVKWWDFVGDACLPQPRTVDESTSNMFLQPLHMMDLMVKKLKIFVGQACSLYARSVVVCITMLHEKFKFRLKLRGMHAPVPELLFATTLYPNCPGMWHCSRSFVHRHLNASQIWHFSSKGPRVRVGMHRSLD